MKPLKIIFILLSLYVGGTMIYGSFGKFKEGVTPIQAVEKVQQFTEPDQTQTLQKVFYINGMKQTGYAWVLVGIAELVLGLLIVFQKTRWIGAILLLPVTLNILLFHIFLEPEEVLELFTTVLLFVANLAIVLKELPKFKQLLWLEEL